jgi:hypothetical protein
MVLEGFVGVWKLLVLKLSSILKPLSFVKLSSTSKPHPYHYHHPPPPNRPRQTMQFALFFFLFLDVSLRFSRISRDYLRQEIPRLSELFIFISLVQKHAKAREPWFV